MYDKNIVEKLFSNIKGKVFKDYKLSKLTFFKTGGLADYLFIPRDLQDLQYFLQNKPLDLPLLILGAGSNLLIRDGGIRGVTIKLNNFNKINILNETTITAESGVLDKMLSVFAKNNNIENFEFLYTIPGTIGGAVTMNAGAYNKEVKDILITSKVIDLEGNIFTLNTNQLGFSYRTSILKNNNNIIILSATFKGRSQPNESIIQNRMDLMEQTRLKTQPSALEKTAGSTFKNPGENKAWFLINQIKDHNLFVGGAKISDKHSNFLINYNNASSKDIEDLGNLIIEKVKNKFNILLEWEIKIVGEFKN